MAHWKFGLMHALLALVLVMSLAMTGCTESDDDEEKPTVIQIDGIEYTLDHVKRNFNISETKTIKGSYGALYTGLSLHIILIGSGVVDPWEHQYRITAADDYSKDVTWGDMRRGVLVEDGMMTSFPDLPGKYRIRDVVSIDIVNVSTINVSGRLYVSKQPFDIFADDLVEETVDNATYTGVRPSDLVNHTGLADGSLHNFTIIGSDDYNKTVNWTVMMGGVLVEADMQIVFPELEAKYWVSDIIEIEVI